MCSSTPTTPRVSVLFNEPKLLKWNWTDLRAFGRYVSVLFNEPKLLKFCGSAAWILASPRFSALQRAEIAEMHQKNARCARVETVSVLFNEPKLLKLTVIDIKTVSAKECFSALQRAEIAEIYAVLVRSFG